jgi:hypothetical protein
VLHQQVRRKLVAREKIGAKDFCACDPGDAPSPDSLPFAGAPDGYDRGSQTFGRHLGSGPLLQGSILQNSDSAENLLDKVLPSNFRPISTLKQHLNVVNGYFKLDFKGILKPTYKVKITSVIRLCP